MNAAISDQLHPIVLPWMPLRGENGLDHFRRALYSLRARSTAHAVEVIDLLAREAGFEYEHFRGITVVVNPRLGKRCQGKANVFARRIMMAPHLHFPTILHEAAHIIAGRVHPSRRIQSHGPEFKAVLRALYRAACVELKISYRAARAELKVDRPRVGQQYHAGRIRGGVVVKVNRTKAHVRDENGAVWSVPFSKFSSSS